MMFRREIHSAWRFGLAASVCAVAVVGCGEEPPPPAPVAAPVQAPPPPPPRPDPVNLVSLLSTSGADARVAFADEAEVYDRSLAQAAIRIASALAAGDDLAFSDLVDGTARGTLDELVNTGEWFEQTDGIESVRVVYFEQSPPQDEDAARGVVIMAVQDADGAYLLGWEAADASGSWRFSAKQTSGDERDSALAWDGLSLFEYEESLGIGGGDVGARLPGLPAGVDIAALLQPLSIYIGVEMNKILLPGLMAKFGLPADDNLPYMSLTGLTGGDLDKVKSLYEEGKTAVSNGERPPPSTIRLMIDTTLEQLKAVPTVPVTREDLISALAKTLNETPENIEKMYDEGAP